MKKYAIAIIIVILLAVGYKFSNFYLSLCDNPPIGTYISPDKKHEAIYFQRGCGNTSPFVENIKLDGKIILKVATSGNANHPLLVKWINDRTLSIETSSTTKKVRVYDIDMNYNNVQMSYDGKILGVMTEEE